MIRPQRRFSLPPEEYERWQRAVGAALGSTYENLVDPLCDARRAMVPETV